MVQLLLTEVHVIVVMAKQCTVAWQYGLVENHHTGCLFPVGGATFHVSMGTSGFRLAFGNHAQLINNVCKIEVDRMSATFCITR